MPRWLHVVLGTLLLTIIIGLALPLFKGDDGPLGTSGHKDANGQNTQPAQAETSETLEQRVKQENVSICSEIEPLAEGVRTGFTSFYGSDMCPRLGQVYLLCELDKGGRCRHPIRVRTGFDSPSSLYLVDPDDPNTTRLRPECGIENISRVVVIMDSSYTQKYGMHDYDANAVEMYIARKQVAVFEWPAKTLIAKSPAFRADSPVLVGEIVYIIGEQEVNKRVSEWIQFGEMRQTCPPERRPLDNEVRKLSERLHRSVERYSDVWAIQGNYVSVRRRNTANELQEAVDDCLGRHIDDSVAPNAALIKRLLRTYQEAQFVNPSGTGNITDVRLTEAQQQWLDTARQSLEKMLEDDDANAEFLKSECAKKPDLHAIRADMPGMILDSERQAAVKILKLGGKVTGSPRPTEVWFPDSVTDEALKCLEALPNLEDVSFSKYQVTDAELECFEGMTSLRELRLRSPKVGDAGLEHIKGLTNLRILGLSESKVGDAGLERLKGLTKLRELFLDETQVTDKGLKHLEGFVDLTDLSLSQTNVGDIGLEHLRSLSTLERLRLDGTRATNAGLASLGELVSLKLLTLEDTQISNTGLEHLKNLNELEILNLRGTRVSDEGVKKLQQALPDCKVRH